MDKLKYILILGLLLAILVASPGCIPTCQPFSWFDEEEEDLGDLTPPEYSYGDGESSVEYIPQDFEGAVNNIESAVVRIESRILQQGWFLNPFPTEEIGIGTGVIIDTANGYIVTNRHVVEDADEVNVTLCCGDKLSATHYWRSQTTDLALVRVRPEDLPEYTEAAEFSNEELHPYTWVVAIGYAYNIGADMGDPTVSQGIISALDRTILIEIDSTEMTLEDVIQTDAAINPGNSGGPLINMAGEIVGINTAVLAEAENMGFAISKDTVVDFIEEFGD
jgi:serine protease Do